MDASIVTVSEPSVKFTMIELSVPTGTVCEFADTWTEPGTELETVSAVSVIVYVPEPAYVIVNSLFTPGASVITTSEELFSAIVVVKS